MPDPTPDFSPEAIAEALREATPWPWMQGQMPEWEDYRIVSSVVREDWEPDEDEPPDWQPPHKVIISGEDCSDADFDLVLNAPTWLAQLLAALEAKDGEVARLREEIARRDGVGKCRCCRAPFGNCVCFGGAMSTPDGGYESYHCTPADHRPAAALAPSTPTEGA